jgi:hypothetical protein
MGMMSMDVRLHHPSSAGSHVVHAFAFTTQSFLQSSTCLIFSAKRVGSRSFDNLVFIISNAFGQGQVSATKHHAFSQ